MDLLKYHTLSVDSLMNTVVHACKRQASYLKIRESGHAVTHSGFLPLSNLVICCLWSDYFSNCFKCMHYYVCLYNVCACTESMQRRSEEDLWSHLSPSIVANRRWAHTAKFDCTAISFIHWSISPDLTLQFSAKDHILNIFPFRAFPVLQICQKDHEPYSSSL